ncbi:MAG: GxxExxY protein [Pirellulales bacterium]
MSDPLTEKIIGAAIEVHRILGPGLLESVYEQALCHEFDLRGIRYQRQAHVEMFYKDTVIKDQRIDLLVEDDGDRAVVDLKSLSRLPDISTAQVLSYLKATGLKRGLLINFGEKRLVDGVRRLSL